jgi:D-3-phosphoglycerate dehydrogenase
VDLNTLLERSDYLTLHVGLTPETRGLLNKEAFARMKDGVRVINCARGELIDTQALNEALASGKVAGAGLDVFGKEPPEPEDPLLKAETLVATPHIGGSTEEAQEIVGIRIAEQMVEYLKNGVVLNAVNMPAVSPEAYKAVAPWITVAERLGSFASHVAEGNPRSVRLVYRGRVGEMNTQLIRAAGLAGIVNRSLSTKANLVNAMRIACERGLTVNESHEIRGGHVDSLQLELVTDKGATVVEGAIVLDRPRLIQVDGIACETALRGHITYMKNRDVPGVIGHVGTVLGRNSINIANFALGREDTPAQGSDALTALAMVETDGLVPESVLEQLRQHPAVLLARSVELEG